MIKIATRNLSRVHKTARRVLGNVESMPYEEGTFDTVVSIY